MHVQRFDFLSARMHGSRDTLLRFAKKLEDLGRFDCELDFSSPY